MNYVPGTRFSLADILVLNGTMAPSSSTRISTWLKRVQGHGSPVNIIPVHSNITEEVVTTPLHCHRQGGSGGAHTFSFGPAVWGQVVMRSLGGQDRGESALFGRVERTNKVADTARLSTVLFF